MDTAKIFMNGRSQAVRLPKEYRFEGDEVYIKHVGSAVMLIPKDDAWRLMRESLSQFPEDFMADRNQPQSAEEVPEF